ncbi:hypothetical protein JYQ62_26595 [Nostoc sp. UHCC 0702]|nr:hypothetical protein JYQ62_26595 [Nostoc sp. UHCC 0702]
MAFFNRTGLRQTIADIASVLEQGSRGTRGPHDRKGLGKQGSREAGEQGSRGAGEKVLRFRHK